LGPRSMAAYSPQAGLLGLSCVLFVRPYLSAIRCARNERQILADDSGSIEHRFRSSKSRRAAVRQTPFTAKNIGRVVCLLSATALCTGLTIFIIYISEPISRFLVGPARTAWLVAVIMVVFMPGASAYRKACRVAALGAEEVRRKDTRRPVLLLRSFRDDETPV